MATAELDIPRLSAFCAVPQTSLTSLLDAPTTDPIRSLLGGLSTRIHEFDGLKAEKLRLNVELENAVRAGESKSRVLKNSIDKGVREAEKLRQKVQEEGSWPTAQSRAALESELESIKTSTASSTSEVTNLNTRITSLESSNRDTLSLLESKTTAYDKLAEELTAQHSKTLELRKEVTLLEQKAQSADATASTAKYHEQSLQQEIEQLKRNNDWLDRELKAKSDEYTKFRKDKGARISELQRQSDEASNTIDAAQRTEQTLRNRIEELSQKLEEYLSRISQLSEEATKAEESHKKSAESSARLIELTRNSASTDRARLQEVQDELEATKENAQDQFGRLASEIQSESDGREAAERRVAELETQIENVQAELDQIRTKVREDGPLHDGTNGQPSTPGRASSPALSIFSPGRSRLKDRLNPTQLVAQNGDLRTQLAAARQENERLSASVDEMLQSAESMRPEIEEVRTEKAQLELNISEMSSLVDHMGKERDQAVKSARKAAGQIEAKIKEGEVLRQQLRDLGTQIKILLFELDRRDRGLDNFSSEQQLQLEQLARGEAEIAGATDTDRLITRQLVMFRNTAELQEQNTNLLRITRELGEKMEREEAMRNEAEAGRDSNDYKQLYEQCQDEIRSLLTQSQSYVRERDMFRRMLTDRGQLRREDNGDSQFGDSVNGGVPPVTPSQPRLLNSIEQSPQANDMADYAKLLKEMQSHFDNYRTEAATDHRTLKEQVDKLSNTNAELRSEVSRSNSQMTLAYERYQMLQSNYEMLKTENTELQKRSQFISDNATKQDLRTQQVAEDLVEAKGLLDSMRNENANLRAEKEFFKTIEKRLNADNEAYFSEKARLNSLNTNLQHLVSEHEKSEGETRRKYQNQVESLEQELQTTKRALSEQTEENKRTSDRREYEHQQSQKKIDDLLVGLGSVREEFAAAKTSRDHLQIRVDELTIELRSAEERVQLLQPASSHRLTDDTDGQTAQPNGDAEQSSIHKEQELAVEISELKRDLSLAKGELEIAKGQVEQYKTISQSSEEELQSLNETQELYRQDMDKMLEERTAKIQELEQRISDIHAELTSTNSELTSLRSKEAEIGRQVQEQRSIFEAEIARLKDEDDRHATAAKYHQEDLKAQVGIAQQAQQNYENELVKHAEAAKALQKVRGENNELKIQIVELKTERDSARTNLTQNEESWLDTKGRYERELEEMKEGRQSLADQNNRLHQQLETLGTQIANLQKRSASDEAGDVENAVTSSGLENLQEVIKYLRREKEIIDVQLELSTQESKRLKQQLDYTQSQLDDTRLKLNQQRRVEQDSERSALNHNKLMDTINELNTFRESNVTLRNESRQAQASLAQKIREVEQLVAQVEPLQAEVRDLKSLQETQAGETKLLKEDRDFWMQRNQDILKKYDRVDPAELEALKTQLQALQTERDELSSSKQTLQEQLDGQIAQAQEQTKERIEELKARLTEQFKTRSKALSGTIREKDASLQTVTTEKQELEQRLGRLEQDLVKANADKDQAVQDAEKANANANVSSANVPSGSEDGQVDEREPPKADRQNPVSEAEAQALQEKLAAAEARANEADSQKSSLENDVAAANARVDELESQIQEIQRQLDAANVELGKLRTQASTNEGAAAANASSEELDKLRSDLEQAQQDANNLRAAASIQASSTETTAEEGGKSVADQLSEMRAAIQAELETRHNERIQKAEQTFERRSQNMKSQLSKKLTEGKEQLRTEKEQALQTLRTAHEKELEDLKRRHQEELDELKRQEETRFADFKAAWIAEHPSKETNTESAEEKKTPIRSTSWQPTDAEARDFIASNPTVKSILSRNISQKVAEAKSAFANQLKEEHAKDLTTKLEEAATKAKADKETAVNNAGKQTALKMNLLATNGKTAQHRLDIVKKAAEDTPQRPVIEVWDMAKAAKLITSTAQQSFNSPSVQTPVRTGSVSQTPPTQQRRTGSPKVASPQTQAAPRPGFFGQPTPLTSLQQSQSPAGQKPQELLSAPQVAAPEVAAPAPVPAQDNPVAQTQTHPPTAPAQSSASQQPNPAANTTQQSTTTQPSSNQAQKQQQPQGQANNHPNAGTGPAALRGLHHHSGLPVARGGNMNRGGRGRGQPSRGRGGPQLANTNPMQAPQQAAPSPPQLNANARQFVPQGNKRPREESSEAGQHGGDGKRIRGGAGEA
ncbi:MAG: hypothetical protein Q9166_001316 [cf. Caloplaca sp. 2 TL-2023]